MIETTGDYAGFPKDMPFRMKRTLKERGVGVDTVVAMWADSKEYRELVFQELQKNVSYGVNVSPEQLVTTNVVLMLAHELVGKSLLAPIE